MKVLSCGNCGAAAYFDNTVCVSCGAVLRFDPAAFQMVALPPEGGGPRDCANAAHGACNWLLVAGDPGDFCRACRHNRTVPDLARAPDLDNWRRIEAAKRHLFYSLLRWGLPIPDRAQDPEGLAFDFLADMPGSDGPVLTGHAGGLITLNIAEGDDAAREARRAAMGEPYRTLLGHFRHEIGHFYWDRLVRGQDRLEPFRALFGDEREDYAQALQRHYADGPAPDWPLSFISAYASAHPWEDFAETWAHYLHITDTLETAEAFGMAVSHPGGPEADRVFQPYAEPDAQALLAAWVPLTVAINAVNRAMGQPDLYPFVLSAPVAAKLQFIADLIHGGRAP